MAESSSFSSLLALVDSHLSQSSVQGTQSNDGTNSIQIQSLNKSQKSLSDSRLSHRERLPIPSFSCGSSPIKVVLAEQVSNMLKAKEKKEQEEKHKLDEEMKKLKLEEESDDCVIDLMKAMQEPLKKSHSYNKVISGSSSFESLLLDELDFKIDDSTESNMLTVCIDPLLPCQTDMLYILERKIPKAKCSAFGKVLTARLRPVPAPYLMEKIESNIVRFDFNTKSPCDLIKEKLRQPPSYNSNNDIVKILGLI